MVTNLVELLLDTAVLEVFMSGVLVDVFDVGVEGGPNFLVVINGDVGRVGMRGEYVQNGLNLFCIAGENKQI